MVYTYPMHKNELNIGDVVRLKSGGPRMTVNVVFVTTLQAVWFDNENRPCELSVSIADVDACPESA